MAQGISAAWRTDIIEWFGNIAASTQPANTYFLQWHTADPTATGAVATSTSLPDRDELTDTGPARWEMHGSIAGRMINTAEGESSLVGAGLGGDTISWFSCWSLVTLGVHLFNGQITTPREVLDGGKLTYDAGDLYCEITGT